MPRGRPNLFVNRHVLQVIVSREEYDVIRRVVEETRLLRPGFSAGDLMREFIERGLGRYSPEPRPADERQARVRQLHAISRTALELARALKTA